VGLTDSTLLQNEEEVDVADFREALDKGEVLYISSHVQLNMYLVAARW